LQETLARKRLKHGILIAFEGIDGAGKTTQAKKLIDRLTNEGYPAICLHEPTEGVYGKKIKELAENGRHNITPLEELELFCKDREEDVKNNINPALSAKKIVVMDRYYLSSMAYQGQRGLSPKKIEDMNRRIAPEPDLIILLDVTSEVSSDRITRERKSIPNAFERKKHLETVRKIFLNISEGRNNVKVIEGNGSHTADQIASHVWAIVAPLVKEKEVT